MIQSPSPVPDLTRSQIIAIIAGAALEQGQRCSSFRGVRLAGVDLSMLDLSGCDFSFADLRGCNLSQTDITDTDFSDADLTGADLTSAFGVENAEGGQTQFQRAQMKGVKLVGARMRAQFECANLTGADLSDAKLEDSGFLDATLHGVKFDRAELRGAFGMLLSYIDRESWQRPEFDGIEFKDAFEHDGKRWMMLFAMAQHPLHKDAAYREAKVAEPLPPEKCVKLVPDDVNTFDIVEASVRSGDRIPFTSDRWRNKWMPKKDDDQHWKRIHSAFEWIKYTNWEGHRVNDTRPKDAPVILARPGMAAYCYLDGESHNVLILEVTAAGAVVLTDEGHEAFSRWGELSLQNVKPDPAFVGKRHSLEE